LPKGEQQVATPSPKHLPQGEQQVAMPSPKAFSTRGATSG